MMTKVFILFIFKVLCCLLGGGPIYGSKDAGGSGATLEQNAVDFQASLGDSTAEGEKHQKAAKCSRVVSHVYGGSGEQLCEQTNQILPLLTTFCTTGLTSAYPPIIPNDTTTSGTKNKRKNNDGFFQLLVGTITFVPCLGCRSTSG